MTDLLSALNSNQKMAVQTVDGPVLIVAGAGTGKTRTLVYRLAYLATEAGIPLENLLAITFTTKAAEEMMERVKSLCRDGVDLSSMWIGTIHSLCYEILQKEASILNLPLNFEIISPSDRKGIVRSLVKEFFSERPNRSIRRYELQISTEKNSLLSYDKLSPFCRAYQEILERQGVLDFDDLIIKTLELFNLSPETAKKLRSRFTHISVDEYQDINFSQYSLIRSLCSPLYNLCVVGDADQAIYGFRGARVENFLNFQRDFPDVKVIHLEENYRSTETILSAAQHVIEKNTKRIEKRLIPTRPPGAEIEICEMPGEQEEAGFVAREIERLLGGTRFENMSHDAEEFVKGFGDIAVLYRLHQQSHPLKKTLQQRGIPVEVAATLSLYEEPDIKPVIDFLEITQNPHNDFALTEILTGSPGSIDPETAEKLKAEAESLGMSLFSLLKNDSLQESLPLNAGAHLSVLVDFISSLIEKSRSTSLDRLIKEIWENLYSNDPEKNDNLFELITSSMPFSHVPASQGIPLFLKKISLLKEGEVFTPRGEAVTLMTVHGAKGLEFPVVFMAGLEDGLFPYQPEKDECEAKDDEEERRLFYVGMTRAKEKLYLLYAQTRFMFGERKKMSPSVFLKDIPEDISRKQAKKSPRKKKKERSKQMKLFAL